MITDENFVIVILDSEKKDLHSYRSRNQRDFKKEEYKK